MPMPKPAWTAAFAAELQRRHESFTQEEALAIADGAYRNNAELTPDEAVEVHLLEEPPLDAGDPADRGD